MWVNTTERAKARVITLASALFLEKRSDPAKRKAFGVFIKMDSVTMQAAKRCRYKCQFKDCTRQITHLMVNRTGTVIPYCILPSGKKILMTVDHKIARSLGGKDSNDNMWLMCLKHNTIKSQYERCLSDIINKRDPDQILISRKKYQLYRDIIETTLGKDEEDE